MTEQELNRVRELSAQIKAIENHLATLRKRAEDITPALDGMPHGSAIQSKVEKLALKIVESGKELESLHDQVIKATAQLTGDICRAVTDPQERTVIILRYISCLHFRDIAFQLGFSDRKVYALHHAALEKLAVDVQLVCS